MTHVVLRCDSFILYFNIIEAIVLCHKVFTVGVLSLKVYSEASEALILRYFK